MLLVAVLARLAVACGDGDAGGGRDAGPCAPDAVVGDTRCEEDVVETCTSADDGSLRWLPQQDCSNGGLACRPVAHRAVCRQCGRGVWEGDYYVGGAGTQEALLGHTAVRGHLEFVFVDLASLDGLECLRDVGGLSIAGNLALTNLDGLSGLMTAGSLDISDNAVLGGLDGLRGVTSIPGDVFFGGNDVLTSLDGLHALTSIGGSLSIGAAKDGCCEDPGPPPGTALTSLDGLAALTSIGGDLDISTNGALVSLDGLRSLVALGGDLSVTDNAALPTCAAIAVEERLRSGGWEGQSTISGNDDTGVCESPAP